MPANSSPETRSVRGANELRIALYKPQPNKLIILAAQDNLVKVHLASCTKYEPYVWL